MNKNDQRADFYIIRIFDFKLEVIIEDLFDAKRDSEEIPQPAGTRVTIAIPVKEEE